uniref:Arsenite methyltransferase n=1 Tax=Crassostrea virginica TaxID=6565 RepID=A0A8B8E997_CRAVI|nr:arsenite methyltransferase-like [Crassostrea virginica]
MKFLDLGNGTGRDCFSTNKADSNFEKSIDYHTEKFGYKESNTDFVQGYIQKLREAGLKENYYDIIISNCVINLSPDKRAILKEAFSVLKEGGEFYFSDIYADRELEDSVRKDEVLWGECISGALYWKELFTLAAEIGFSRPFLVTAAPVPIDREDFKKILGDARFVSVTYRLFKLPPGTKAEPTQGIYNGQISGYEKEFRFDHQHVFKKDDVVTVTGPVAASLKCSRFSDEFDYQPVPKKTCDTSACNGSSPDKVDFEDPFEYLEKLKQTGQKVESSCCGGSKKCC